MPYRSLRYRSPRRGKSGTAPVLNTPSVSGANTVGSTLTVGTITYANNPNPTPVVTHQWQWSANGITGWTDIGGGATGNTYVIAAGDYNRFIRDVVTATNSIGADSKNTPNTGPVPGVAPVLNAMGSVSGTVKEGQTVSVSPTVSQGAPTPSYTYQWQYSTDGSSGWTNIGSATASSYTIDVTYAGYFLRCNVTATNAVGSDTKATSGTRIDTLYFGDGSDGDATISVDSTVSTKKYRSLTLGQVWVTPSAASTLIQICRTLTIDQGRVNGFIANGVVGATGIVSSNTGYQAGATGGAGGPGGTTGGTGGDSTPSNGSAGSNVSSNGSGGTGGIGETNTSSGGVGGTATTGTLSSAKSAIQAKTYSENGGAGGGGGGTSSPFSYKGNISYYGGAGGGGGAGVVRVLAQHVADAGGFFRLRAIGGDGGPSTGSVGSGAGGGGGGGTILFGTYDASYTGATPSVLGGAAGTNTKGGGAGSPTAGANGRYYVDTGAGD